jgi:energy-coupling factor transporter ATP-binding protein EcfA2
MGSIYGFEIETDLQLQRLNGARGERGTLVLAESPSPLEIPAEDPVATLETEDGGATVYAAYEVGENCLLTMPPSGSFLIEPRPGRITTDASERDELFEHRLESAALCTLLAMRGDLALHAAAVEAGESGKAVVFCGPSHRGKSTIARTLAAAGHRVLAEDGLIITVDGTPVAYPGARGIRVRDEGGRVTLDSETGAAEPSPGEVAAVILLGERGVELTVERLEPAEAMARFTSSLIHSGTREGIAGAFGNLARLLHTVPPVLASVPDDLGALPQAAEELLDSALVAQ